MPDYHAIQQDVVFDYGGAQELAAEFRSVARVVDDHVAQRVREARVAQEEWRGRYREDFDGRLHTTAADGGMLADKLRLAAAMLDRAYADARAEQARRDRARQEMAELENRSLWEKAVDYLFGADAP